jgi:hypothetical protein
VEPLGAADLLAPVAGGTWLGAGEPPVALVASVAAAFTVASSATLSSPALFTVASLAAAAFTATSSTTLFTVASSVALFAAASLSAVTAGPVAESCHNRFCKGSSSSDDTSSSSRMMCVYLPLPRATVLEPPAAPLDRPPRRHCGYLLDRHLLGCLHGRDHQRCRSDRRARG